MNKKKQGEGGSSDYEVHFFSSGMFSQDECKNRELIFLIHTSTSTRKQRLMGQKFRLHIVEINIQRSKIWRLALYPKLLLFTRTLALGSTQPLTKMSTRNLPRGKQLLSVA
jgi:hypothetical protein